MRFVFIVTLLLSPALWAVEVPAEDYICGNVTVQNERQQCIEKAQLFTHDSRVKRSTKETPLWVNWLWPVSWWIVYYGFGIIIGSYVYCDAKKRDWVFLGIRPFWWVVLVLFDPALGLLAYWATHYSTLALSYAEAQDHKLKP